MSTQSRSNHAPVPYSVPLEQTGSASPSSGSRDADCTDSYGGPLGIRHLRLRLSQDQVDLLEASFRARPYLTAADRERLSQQVGLQPKQVAVWFQNRRARLRLKQGGNRPATSPGASSRPPPAAPASTRPAPPHAPGTHSPGSGRCTTGMPVSMPFAMLRDGRAAPEGLGEPSRQGASAPAPSAIPAAPPWGLASEARAGHTAMPAGHADGSLEAVIRALGGVQSSAVGAELRSAPSPRAPPTNAAANAPAPRLVPAAARPSAAQDVMLASEQTRAATAGNQMVPQDSGADLRDGDGAMSFDPDALCNFLVELLAEKAPASAPAEAEPLPDWRQSSAAVGASGSSSRGEDIVKMSTSLAARISELQRQLDIMAEGLASPVAGCARFSDPSLVDALITASMGLLNTVPPPIAPARPQPLIGCEESACAAEEMGSPTKRPRAMPAATAGGASKQAHIPVPIPRAQSTSKHARPACASPAGLTMVLPIEEPSWKQEILAASPIEAFDGRSWVEDGSLVRPQVDEVWPGIPQQTLLAPSPGKSSSIGARGRSPHGFEDRSADGVPHGAGRTEKRGRTAAWSPSRSSSSRAEPVEAAPQSPSVMHGPGPRLSPLQTLSSTEFQISLDSLTLVSTRSPEPALGGPSSVFRPGTTPMSGTEPSKAAGHIAPPCSEQHFAPESVASQISLPRCGRGSGVAEPATGPNIGMDMFSDLFLEDPPVGDALPALAHQGHTRGLSSDSAASLAQSVMSVRDVEEILAAEEVAALDSTCAERMLGSMHETVAPGALPQGPDALKDDDMDVPSMLMSFLDRL